MAMDFIEEMLKAVSQDLAGVATGDAVLGSPVKLGDVTVYPVSSVSVGMAGGGGEGETTAGEAGARGEKGVGGGTGGGARACPVAVIVLSPSGLKVLPLPQRKGAFERLLEKIPSLVEKVKEATA
jgi:uncharacterized spore protein YtfJ